MEKTCNDGGLLLLNEVDNQIGLIDRLTECINDNHRQGYVKHRVESMLRQRIMRRLQQDMKMPMTATH